MKFNYKCSQCQKDYDIKPNLYVCPSCASSQRGDEPLKGILEVELTGNLPDNWDVFDLLPVEKQYFPPAPVGNTPLWSPENLRRELGMNRLYIKDDAANPTASYKDRASYLVSAYAKKFGVGFITLASTGNAGASMSGIGASASQKIVLFLPETAPPAKIVQSLQFGASVYKVKGNYDKAYEMSLEYSAKHGGMNRSTGYNPMTIEGKKTSSIEIFLQLNKNVPDYVFVPTGDGAIIAGVYKGFRDLFTLGLAKKIPTIYCVQSDGSDAIIRAYESGKFEFKSATTIADSISVDVPKNGYHALQQLKTHSGKVIRVTDDEIIKAQAKLSASSGLFTEPAGAAAMAGLLKIANTLNKEASIVVLATGSGLKDTKTALLGVKEPPLIGAIDEIK